jgi:hypothetical protein
LIVLLQAERLQQIKHYHFKGRKFMKEPRIGRMPTKPELIDFIVMLAVRMVSMSSRWDNGISVEVRDEILTELYDPTINMVTRCRRRIGTPDTP